MRWPTTGGRTVQLHDRTRAFARTESFAPVFPEVRPETIPDQAVILAAGAGTRIRQGLGAPPKPLTPVLGRTLIERSFRAMTRFGVSRLTLVVGYEGDAVASTARDLAARYGLDVTIVVNRRWELGNGTSVLAAAPYVSGPFFVAMGDHLFDPAILDVLSAMDDGAELSLAVDHDWPDIPDLEEATKVRLSGRAITRIGKEISVFDAVDTGLFLCREGLFDALERAEASGDASLTGAVRILASERAAVTAPVTGLFWQDVDTPADLALAEHRLLKRRRHRDYDLRGDHSEPVPV
ncbi:MAG: NTP transferase domain-containing protein [Dehalococcoidia bacterium]|nr:NTP transferase domain-containing protein [Dehalococcoidia bacterium]